MFAGSLGKSPGFPPRAPSPFSCLGAFRRERIQPWHNDLRPKTLQPRSRCVRRPLPPAVQLGICSPQTITQYSLPEGTAAHQKCTLSSADDGLRFEKQDGSLAATS